MELSISAHASLVRQTAKPTAKPTTRQKGVKLFPALRAAAIFTKRKPQTS